MDPYKVLGVSPSASDDEIKKAYRNLSRKYHPDSNMNSAHPEIAEAKFKEVQQAYDIIMKRRQNGGSDSTSGGYGGGQEFNDFWSAFGGFGGFGTYGSYSGRTQNTYQSESDTYLKAAANYINSGHYKEALNVLDSIKTKNGTWYYYHAAASAGLGNNIQALESAKRAVEIEPDNQQYRMLLNRLQSGGSWYQTRSEGYGRSLDGMNNWCCQIIVLNAVLNLCCCRPY